MRTFCTYTMCFVGGFAVLSLETLGFRLLAPYFGSSVYVTGSMIGVILISLSLGYWLGGRICGWYVNFRIPPMMLLVAGFWIYAIYLLKYWIAGFILNSDEIVGSLVVSFVLFALPMVLLGALTPYLAKMREREETLASIIGNLSAVSALGSLFGCFVTTFFLLTHIGVEKTIWLNSILLFGSAAFSLTCEKRIFGISFAILLVGFINPIRRADKNLIDEAQSLYGLVQVFSSIPPTLDLRINGKNQTLYNPVFKEGLAPDYTGIASCLPATLSEINNPFLLIGLGGGNIAKSWRKFFSAQVDVIEVDAVVIQMTKSHFNFGADEGIRVFNEDGRRGLRTKGVYDLIVLDAFNGRAAPPHLLTVEYFQEVQSHLSHSGLFAINVACPDLNFNRAIANTIHVVFPQVYVLPQSSGNSMLIAMNEPKEERVLDAAIRRFAQSHASFFVSSRLRPNFWTFNSRPTDLIFTDDLSTAESLQYLAIRKCEIGREDNIGELLTQWPDDEGLNLRAAAFEKNAGREDRAIKIVKKVLEKHPDSPKALTLVIEDMLARKESVASIEKLLRRGLDEWPESPRLLAIMGSLELKKGKQTRAVALLQKSADLAVSGDDGSAWILEHLGRAYLKIHRPQKARAAFVRALSFKDVEDSYRGLRAMLARADFDFIRSQLDRLEQN